VGSLKFQHTRASAVPFSDEALRGKYVQRLANRDLGDSVFACPFSFNNFFSWSNPGRENLLPQALGNVLLQQTTRGIAALVYVEVHKSGTVPCTRKRKTMDSATQTSFALREL